MILINKAISFTWQGAEAHKITCVHPCRAAMRPPFTKHYSYTDMLVVQLDNL